MNLRILKRYGMFTLFSLVALILVLSTLTSAEGKLYPFTVQYGNKTYNAGYLITGDGEIKNITARELGITITIQSQQNGDLFVSIPKELLTATRISYDFRGFVPGIFVDGREAKTYYPDPYSETIFFRIPIEGGTEKIEIVGTDTTDTPEFDGFVFLVIGISVAGVLITTIRYQRKIGTWKP